MLVLAVLLGAVRAGGQQQAGSLCDCGAALDPLEQADPKLVERVRQCFLSPLSPLPHNFTRQKETQQYLCQLLTG